MRLLSEILRAIGDAGAGVLYTVADGGAYFQNVRKIAEFSPTVLVLRGKRGALRVEGKDLVLFKYSGGDAAVRGTVERVFRE